MDRIKLGITLKSLASPFRRALRDAQKLGLTGVELDLVGDFAPQQLTQTGRRELRHLLSSHNLELTALHCPLRRGLDVPENQEARIDHLRQCLTLAFELGPRIVRVAAGKIVDDEKDPRSQWLKDALVALGQFGDRVGSVLALETGLDSGPVMAAYLDKFDSGSLMVDYTPAHFLTHGFDPYEALTVLGPRIVQIHAKDARAAIPGRVAQEVPLGHGDLDWLQILAMLAQREYRGWLVVEGDASGVTFLRRLIGA